MQTIRRLLTPEHTRTCIDVLFRVPDGTAELILTGWYGPTHLLDEERARELAIAAIEQYAFLPEHDPNSERRRKIPDDVLKQFLPIRNLPNYSLFDPDGTMRGRVNANGIFRVAQINEESASLGCVPGPVLPGEWKMVFEVFAVVTDTMEIVVHVDTKETAGPPVDNALPVHEERRKLDTMPRVDGTIGVPGWYRGDFHVHSHHSDGNGSVDQVIETMIAWGLDFFFLTDHNTTQGWREGLDRLRGITVIPGIEVSTVFGHALALDYTEYVSWFHLTRDTSLVPLVAEIQSRGGLFGAAHPFTIGDPLCCGCRWEFTGLPWESCDIIEVWNGSWDERHIEIRRAISKWEELLNSGATVVATSGSDTHNLDTKPTGFAWPHVYAENRSREAIVEGLRRGRVYLSCGPRIEFTIHCNDRIAQIGDEVRVRKASAAVCRIAVDEHVNAELVCRGRTVDRGPCTPDGREVAVTIHESCWYTVKIYGGNGRLVGLTNPIRFVVE